MRPNLFTASTAAAVFAVLIAGGASQSPAPGFDVSGTWTFVVTSDAGASRAIVTFRQDGETVTGHYSSQMLGEADVAGTVRGPELTFTFMGNMQGTSVPVTYKALVSSNEEMAGTVDVAMVMEGMFTAQHARFGGERETIPPTYAADGRQMFQTYCASCHGANGKGDGPVARNLSTPPTDLTSLKARNRGAFPAIGVRSAINGSVDISAHGTTDMPVWGALFAGLDHDPALKELRLDRLTEYVESIQK